MSFELVNGLWIENRTAEQLPKCAAARPELPEWKLRFLPDQEPDESRRDRTILLVLENLNIGAPVRDACKAAGISKSAFYEWCAKDPELVLARDAAESLGIIEACKTLRQAIRLDRDWKAAMTMLERKRDDFKRWVNHKHQGVTLADLLGDTPEEFDVDVESNGDGDPPIPLIRPSGNGHKTGEADA